jgi:hypothetical protein
LDTPPPAPIVAPTPPDPTPPLEEAGPLLDEELGAPPPPLEEAGPLLAELLDAPPPPADDELLLDEEPLTDDEELPEDALLLLDEELLDVAPASGAGEPASATTAESYWNAPMSVLPVIGLGTARLRKSWVIPATGVP